ncbi:alpha/beta fold hydrolase [Streptomyces sp. NPDC057271]|uniref:alpha/beta fold hydrolase n=1 Tax=unclassified Streptomyces TaxID=2593676 RepID=UPI00362775A9
MISAKMLRIHNGTPVQLTCIGSGPTVVVVHGVMSTSENWLDVARQLAPTHQCLLLNRRGRTPEAGLGADYGLDTEVADLRDLLNDLGTDVTLVGHSYGGTIALLAALEHPDLRSLVLYEPAWPLSGSIGGSAVRLIAETVARGDLDTALAAILTRIMNMPPEAVDQLRDAPQWQAQRVLVPAAVAELRALDALPPTLARFAQLATPTRILLGEVTPAESPFSHTARALMDVIPDAVLERVPGQGHLAHAFAPARLAAVIATAGLA